MYVKLYNIILFSILSEIINPLFHLISELVNIIHLI